MNGASMTQGIVEGNNEVLSAPLDDEKETLKLQAAKASQETNGQSEEGLKKKEKERLKKKRSDAWIPQSRSPLLPDGAVDRRGG
jgi:hypothetical protein